MPCGEVQHCGLTQTPVLLSERAATAKNGRSRGHSRLRRASHRLRRAGPRTRLPKLLTYLVDRTIRGEVPKEFDISVDVFGKAKGDIDAPDAQTRVHIYKLRARLDSYYGGAGKHDPLRLDIPKGTYHLSAVANETTPRRSTAVRSVRTPADDALCRRRVCSLRSCCPSPQMSHCSRAARRRASASSRTATFGRA